MPSQLKTLNDWVDQIARLTRPDRIHWCDGSQAESEALTDLMLASGDLIALNPPFHTGAAVHERLALGLFADAARVLAPGGELWTVWNSHLRYRSALERLVGPTRQVARNAKFTVTVSRSG